MIIVWIPVALTLLVLSFSTLLSWRGGSAADRIVATGFLIDETVSLFTLDWNHWIQVQASTLTIDLILLVVLTATTIRWLAFDRILLSSLQLLVVSVHVARAAGLPERHGAYALTLCGLTYLQALVLLVAMVARARRRANDRST